MLQGAKSYLQTLSLPNGYTKRCDHQCLHSVTHRRHNNLLSLMSLMSLMMLMILLTLLQSPFTTAQVPNDLPAILSLIYSNIPQIKAGSDSRIGFGYAIGNQADFQILFEFGPQKFTKPLGNQDKSKESSKRQVNISQQQRTVSGNVSNDKNTQSAWLEKWSSNMDVTAKKKVSVKDVEPKKPVVQKPDLVQLLPPQITHRVMQQLPKVHKIVKTSSTEESVSKGSKVPDAAASLLPEIKRVDKEPATTKDLEVVTQKPQLSKKAEDTKKS